MLDFKICPTLSNEKNDKANIRNFAFIFSLMLTSLLQQLDVNQSPRRSGNEIDSAWGKRFLGGEETVKQVCLNEQRLNVNV